jgi:putative aldouronate transport system substrate-binding protein
MAAVMALALLCGTAPLAARAADEPIHLSIWINMPWFFTDVFGQEDVSKILIEKTGVTLDVQKATDDTQLPVMIASGDLPDLVYSDDDILNSQLSIPDISWPMNELAAQYGVTLSASETDIFNNTLADGNYYSITNYFTPQERFDSGEALASTGTSAIVYNTKLYEELGSPAVNSLEDLENVLLAAKAAYPDLVPLLNDKDNLFSYFTRQLGIPVSNYLIKTDDGKIIHRLSDPRILDYYKLLNRFAREGLISAESQTYSFEQYIEAKDSGKMFMGLRTASEAYGANDIAQQWTLLNHHLSDKAVIVSAGVGWASLFITKNCSNPEAAIKFFDYCRTEEGRKLTSWGIQGQQWDYDSEGRTYRPDAYKALLVDKTPQQLGVGVWIFGDRGDETSFIDYSASDDVEMQQYYNYLKASGKITKVLPELSFAIPAEGDEQIIFNALKTLIDDYSLRIIFSETEEASLALYDEMIAHAKDLGIEKLEAWSNATVEAKLASVK